MIRLILVLLFLVVGNVSVGYAQISDDIYYVVGEEATWYVSADSSWPAGVIPFRESVTVLGREDNWWKVKISGLREGYVANSALSNSWIRISLSQHMLFFYEGLSLNRKLPVDLPWNAPDSIESDVRPVPVGEFFVAGRQDNIKFHRALVLNFPRAKEAAKAFRLGYLTYDQFQAILEAERSFLPPPLTNAFGLLRIHGHGTGTGVDWTDGDMALQNTHVDVLWRLAKLGTPVIIEE